MRLLTLIFAFFVVDATHEIYWKDQKGKWYWIDYCDLGPGSSDTLSVYCQAKTKRDKKGNLYKTKTRCSFVGAKWNNALCWNPNI